MDVIEFKQNSRGEFIAYENSIALSSEENSSDQASQWLAQIPMDIRRIVVVGAGSGHHIQEMVRSGRFEQIDVVDCRPALIGGFRKRFSFDRSAVHTHLYENEEALLKSDLFQEVIEQKTGVYFFHPCFGGHQKELFAFVQVLTGRSKKSLEKVLASLGLDLEIQEHSDLSQTWLSIKDLGLIVDTMNVGHPSASAIRILRELVV